MTQDNNTVETVETTVAVAAPMIDVAAAMEPVIPTPIKDSYDTLLNTDTLADVVSDAPDGPVLAADVATPTIGSEEVKEPKAKKVKKVFNVPAMVQSVCTLSHDAMRTAFTPFKSGLARMLETSNNASIGNWLTGTNKLPENYLEVVAAKTNTSAVTILIPTEELAAFEEQFAGYNDTAIAQFTSLLDLDANAKNIAKEKAAEEAAKKKEEKAAAKEAKAATAKAAKEAKEAAAAAAVVTDNNVPTAEAAQAATIVADVVTAPGAVDITALVAE